MSPNKQTVQAYFAAYARLDHAAILACLSDEVEWLVPGAFCIRGKGAFDREIESDCFIGPPQIETHRLTEENDVVVAEGRVRTMQREGGELLLDFCDVFELSGGKIRRLVSYLVVVPRD